MLEFEDFEEMIETFGLVHGRDSLHMVKALMAVDALLTLAGPDAHAEASQLATVIITEHALAACVPVGIVQEAVKLVSVMRKRVIDAG